MLAPSGSKHSETLLSSSLVVRSQLNIALLQRSCFAHRLSSGQPRCLLRTGWPADLLTAKLNDKLKASLELVFTKRIQPEELGKKPLPHSSFASCPAAHRLTLYPPGVIDVTHIFDRSGPFVRNEQKI